MQVLSVAIVGEQLQSPFEFFRRFSVKASHHLGQNSLISSVMAHQVSFFRNYWVSCCIYGEKLAGSPSSDPVSGIVT